MEFNDNFTFFLEHPKGTLETQVLKLLVESWKNYQCHSLHKNVSFLSFSPVFIVATRPRHSSPSRARPMAGPCPSSPPSSRPWPGYAPPPPLQARVHGQATLLLFPSQPAPLFPIVIRPRSAPPPPVAPLFSSELAPWPGCAPIPLRAHAHGRAAPLLFPSELAPWPDSAPHPL